MIIGQIATILLIGIWSIHSVLNRYWIEPAEPVRIDPWRWMN